MVDGSASPAARGEARRRHHAKRRTRAVLVVIEAPVLDEHLDLYRSKYLADSERLPPPLSKRRFRRSYTDSTRWRGPTFATAERSPSGATASRPRPVFTAVEAYHASPRVRRACRAAIDRLPPRQQETIDAYFYQGVGLAEIAARRDVAVSTVGNTKVAAERKLAADDVFYCALDALGRVRDLARRREIERRYPGGRLPDGKRIVWIDSEAA